MLVLRDKDFKAAILTILNGTKKDMLMINKDIKLWQRNEKYKKRTKWKFEHFKLQYQKF